MLPGFAAIGRDLEGSDAFVGVHDLHAEPVCRNTFLVVQLQRGGYRAGDVGPRYVDDTNAWLCEGGEGIGEEVEVIEAATGTLINNLGRTLTTEGWISRTGAKLP